MTGTVHNPFLQSLKKALHREASQVGFLAIEDVDRVFASAETALSRDAEPVEWQRRAGDYGWQRVNDEDLPHYREKGAELRALYDHPQQPAPSVAVKTLHQAATDFMHIFIQDGHLTVQDVEDLDLIPAYERLSAALSTQVQDVSADYFEMLVLRAREAAVKASRKFPQPNYVALKIAEEAGEVVRGAVHYAEGRMQWEEVEGEIVHLLAMLINPLRN